MKSTHDVVSRLSVARYINLKIGNGNGQFLETNAEKSIYLTRKHGKIERANERLSILFLILRIIIARRFILWRVPFFMRDFRQLDMLHFVDDGYFEFRTIPSSAP